MKSHLDTAKQTFGPQCFKTFEGALDSFFSQECPQLGGALSRKALVNAIAGLVGDFYPSSTNMAQGQIRMTVVHKDEKSSYGKTISQSRLVPVVLDLLPKEEIQARADGAKLRDIKIDAVARLFRQTYEQNGVLTNAEAALLLKISPSTAGTYRREWEKNNGSLLPSRGSIHDMGPTLTHKKIILEKLCFQGKTVETVCRETDHSPEAVLRYATNFKQALLCQSQGLDVEQTSFITKLSKALILEYLALIEGYKTIYANLPDGNCSQIETILKKLDLVTSSNQTSLQNQPVNS